MTLTSGAGDETRTGHDGGNWAAPLRGYMMRGRDQGNGEFLYWRE